jgi:hypothetical protein
MSKTYMTIFVTSAGIVLAALGAWSLWAGKTIGLYGVIETRTSPFYWIIVLTYLGLGALNVISGVRLFLR